MPSSSYFYSTAQSPNTPLSTFLAGSAPAPKKPVVAPPASALGGGPFTVNPGTQPGVGPYGTVPGPIGVPPSTYEGAQSIYPGLAGLTATAGGNIAHELAGDFSPQTENALWDTANKFGVASGMPGAGLWSNRFMGNVAGAKEKLQAQGQGDYNNFLASLAKNTNDPNLLAQIAARNATMAAAPNPQDAANALSLAYQRAMMNNLNNARGPAGGTANPYLNKSPAGGTMPTFNPYLPPSTNGPAPTKFSPGGDTTDYSGYDLDALLFGEDPTGFWGGPESLGGNFTPANTVYNPGTNTSDYNPLGDPWGVGWDTNNSYDPYSDPNNSNWDPFDEGGW